MGTTTSTQDPHAIDDGGRTKKLNVNKLGRPTTDIIGACPHDGRRNRRREPLEQPQHRVESENPFAAAPALATIWPHRQCASNAKQAMPPIPCSGILGMYVHASQLCRLVEKHGLTKLTGEALGGGGNPHDIVKHAPAKDESPLTLILYRILPWRCTGANAAHEWSTGSPSARRVEC